VIYDIRHITTYSYSGEVTYAHCALRLLPRSDPGQTVISAELIIDPKPVRTEPRTCFFGNSLITATLATAHRKLRVEARSRVAVERDAPPDAGATMPWEAAREAAFASQTLAPASPAHMLHASRLAPLLGPVTDYARQSFPPGRPVLDAAIDLMRRIQADFIYDPKATLVTTPLGEAFAARRGVCQDFAHVMIAGLRGLGLPASYVSGYLRTLPPPGQKRLEGADASHAWVALWCGPDIGFIGLDPTNGVVVGDDHVVLAIGRDYADVAPIGGVLLGSGDQRIDVAVDVIPVG
jgi:transglutaminase-like putative cysteine protease